MEINWKKEKPTNLSFVLSAETFAVLMKIKYSALFAEIR
jgi:hypothetical protein